MAAALWGGEGGAQERVPAVPLCPQAGLAQQRCPWPGAMRRLRALRGEGLGRGWAGAAGDPQREPLVLGTAEQGWPFLTLRELP